MKIEPVILEVSKGWKIYQVIGGLVAIAGASYMAVKSLEIIEYAGMQAVLLAIFMVLVCLSALYSMLYGFRHRIVFQDSKMSRQGVFHTKEIPYEEISNILFTHSYWKISPPFKLLGDPKAIHIDFKYDRDKKEKATRYLKNKFERKGGPKVVKQ